LKKVADTAEIEFTHPATRVHHQKHLLTQLIINPIPTPLMIIMAANDAIFKDP